VGRGKILVGLAIYQPLGPGVFALDRSVGPERRDLETSHHYLGNLESERKKKGQKNRDYEEEATRRDQVRGYNSMRKKFVTRCVTDR